MEIKSFLKALSDSFKHYQSYGARSAKKLLPIHNWFAEILQIYLGKDYEVRNLGQSSESIIEGKYYPKKLDISVIKDKKMIATISLKFVMSNYRQNAINYFENLLGETANIRRANVGFAHFLILRSHPPYYKKYLRNQDKKAIKMESLKESDIIKYLKLFEDFDFPHRPEVLGMAIIDFDQKENAYFENLESLGFKKETIALLEKKFSLETFIRKFIALCEIKS